MEGIPTYSIGIRILVSEGIVYQSVPLMLLPTISESERIPSVNSIVEMLNTISDLDTKPSQISVQEETISDLERMYLEG
jgi:hypothetical protein